MQLLIQNKTKKILFFFNQKYIFLKKITCFVIYEVKIYVNSTKVLQKIYDILLPGSVSGTELPKWNWSRWIRIRNTAIFDPDADPLLLLWLRLCVVNYLDINRWPWFQLPIYWCYARFKYSPSLSLRSNISRRKLNSLKFFFSRNELPRTIIPAFPLQLGQVMRGMNNFYIKTSAV